MSSTLSKLLSKLFILRALLWQIMSRVPDPDFSYKLNPFSQNCTLRSRGCNFAQITWKKHVALVLETWFFGIKWGRISFCIDLNPILSSFTCESTSMITVYESDGKQLFVVRWSLPWDRPEIRRRCCAEVIVTQITTEAGHPTLHLNCASYRYISCDSSWFDFQNVVWRQYWHLYVLEVVTLRRRSENIENIKL